jgi:NAD(P)-dependent dehydrogenase (short-subunit alcohol dehydrogenase family)
MSPAAVRFDFSGSRVLVTGGSNGIGAGIARAFLDAGADVSITGTRPSASDYPSDLSAYRYFPLELTDPAAIERVASAHASLDVLVNNAGATFPGGRNEYIPEVFEQAVAINLFGAFRMASACKPLLAASSLAGGASVVNLASMSSYFAVPMVPGYGAAKAAVVQMTKNLAVAWAGDRIRVNAVDSVPGSEGTRRGRRTHISNLVRALCQAVYSWHVEVNGMQHRRHAPVPPASRRVLGGVAQ